MFRHSITSQRRGLMTSRATKAADMHCLYTTAQKTKVVIFYEVVQRSPSFYDLSEKGGGSIKFLLSKAPVFLCLNFALV